MNMENKIKSNDPRLNKILADKWNALAAINDGYAAKIHNKADKKYYRNEAAEARQLAAFYAA